MPTATGLLSSARTGKAALDLPAEPSELPSIAVSMGTPRLLGWVRDEPSLAGLGRLGTLRLRRDSSISTAPKSGAVGVLRGGHCSA